MKNAPEFDELKPSHKSLIRKLGESRDHELVMQETIAKGWDELEGSWVKINRKFFGGGTINFTLFGWEAWCRQVDVEEGKEPTPFFFD